MPEYSGYPEWFPKIAPYSYSCAPRWMNARSKNLSEGEGNFCGSSSSLLLTPTIFPRGENERERKREREREREKERDSDGTKCSLLLSHSSSQIYLSYTYYTPFRPFLERLFTSTHFWETDQTENIYSPPPPKQYPRPLHDLSSVQALEKNKVEEGPLVREGTLRSLCSYLWVSESH